MTPEDTAEDTTDDRTPFGRTELPDTAPDTKALDVRVEEEDAGWVVVSYIDGERTRFGDPHPDREQAEFYAKHMFASSDRWTDAAEKDRPRPETYPGDGDPSVP